MEKETSLKCKLQGTGHCEQQPKLVSDFLRLSDISIVALGNWLRCVNQTAFQRIDTDFCGVCREPEKRDNGGGGLMCKGRVFSP